MDLLQKELERKRKAIELAKKQSHISINSKCTQDGTAANQSNTEHGRGKKKRVYLKASEMIKFQQEQEEAKRRFVVQLEEENSAASAAPASAGTKRSRTTDDAVLTAASGESTSHRHHDKKACSDNHPFNRNVAVAAENSSSTSILQHGLQDEEMLSNTAVKHDMDDHDETNDQGNHVIIATNSSSSCSIPCDSQETKSGMNVTPVMTSEQITVALRELGIPVRLFGETKDELRLVRLEVAKEHKRSIMAGMSDIDDFKLGSGHGIRNPFLQKDKNGGHHGSGGGGGGGDDYNKNIGGDYEDKLVNRNLLSQQTLQGSNKSSLTDSNIGVHQPSVAAAAAEEEINLDNDPHKAIHRFFKLQLKQWEEDLVHRPEAVKRTLQGKNETKTLKQCKDYIRPLFKLCKNRRLEQSMMEHLVKIVKYCQEGEFVKANDAYMDVAIGRAAWPIGVTMVGIHARSGRSKIESNNVAHVMNSELQRKYLTSVKRLITYCQKKRTDVAPSKKVVNL
jgi:Prp18 domain.